MHLAVVDPGVGTERRPIALQVARATLPVEPDNGSTVPAAERLGGVVAAHALENRSLCRSSVSHTFHGRDIFAPVAAHLAAGTPIGEVGPAIDPAELVRLDLPGRIFAKAASTPASLRRCVRQLSPGRAAGRSGSARTRLEPGDRFTVRIGSTVHEMRWQPTFGAVEAGALLLFEDADYAGLAIGINRGSAAERLGLDHDTPVRIEPA